MKAYRYILVFFLLLALVLRAQNQDSRKLESLQEGPLVVRAVYVDSQGVKWFGTSKGLCRYDDLNWRYYTEADHLPARQVNALAFEDRGESGHLWVATSGGVAELSLAADGVSASSSYTMDEGLLDDEVSAIVLDSRNDKFFGSASGITWYRDGNMEYLRYSEYPGSLVNGPIVQMDIYQDTLYIAQDGGIGRFVSGVDGISGASRWTSEYGITPYASNIQSVMVKGVNQQWFGTDVGVELHQGYEAKQNWSLLSTSDGLVNNSVLSIAADPDGGLWFGTEGGVSHFTGDEWTSYTSADGLLGDQVYAIGFDPDGSVWFGTDQGACRLREGVFQDFITAVPDRSFEESDMMLHYQAQTGMIHLAYHLRSGNPVRAQLYDVRGVLVKAWDELPALAGENRAELPAGDLESGIYVLQLIYGNQSCTGKVLIHQ